MYIFECLCVDSYGGFEVFVDFFQEVFGGELVLLVVDQECEVFGYIVVFYCFDDSVFECFGEFYYLFIVVYVAVMGQVMCLGKDGSDGVGGGLFIMLVLVVVMGDSVVSSFCFNCFVIWGYQDRGYQVEGVEVLGNGVGLNVVIIVFVCLDKIIGLFYGCSNYVVDQMVFVGNVFCLECVFEFGVKDVLEDIFEVAVIGFQDCVFGGQVNWLVMLQVVIYVGVCEVFDVFIQVVYVYGNVGVWEVEDFVGDWFGIVFWNEGYGQFVWFVDEEVGSVVLVVKGVMADDYWLLLVWNQVWNVGDDNWFVEDNIVEDVVDGVVWGMLYFFEVKFFNVGFVWCDGCVFDVNVVVFDGFSSFDGDLVVCFVMFGD